MEPNSTLHSSPTSSCFTQFLCFSEQQTGEENRDYHLLFPASISCASLKIYTEQQSRAQFRKKKCGTGSNSTGRAMRYDWGKESSEKNAKSWQMQIANDMMRRKGQSEWSHDRGTAFQSFHGTTSAREQQSYLSAECIICSVIDHLLSVSYESLAWNSLANCAKNSADKKEQCQVSTAPLLTQPGPRQHLTLWDPSWRCQWMSGGGKGTPPRHVQKVPSLCNGV